MVCLVLEHGQCAADTGVMASCHLFQFVPTNVPRPERPSRGGAGALSLAMHLGPLPCARTGRLQGAVLRGGFRKCWSVSMGPSVRLLIHVGKLVLAPNL